MKFKNQSGEYSTIKKCDLMKPKLKKLIQAINKIDPKAAEYIEETVFPRYYSTDTEPPDGFEALFLWRESPQGHKYWMDIYLKLEGKK